jgi:hemerythrin
MSFGMPSAGVALVWRDDWLLGIETVDADHKELVRLLNLLLSEGGGGSPDRGAPQASPGRRQPGTEQLARFSALVDHLHDHFRREEEIMLSVRYLDFDAHRGEHSMQIAELTELRRRLTDSGGRRRLDPESLEWVKRWCFDHFVTEDRRFAEFYLLRKQP